jgi:Putative Ig domain
MHFRYLGTVYASRYIQPEDDRLVPQFREVEGSMLYPKARKFKSDAAFLKSRFSSERTQRLSVLILLLAVALITTSCGTVAQAAGTQSGPQTSLKLSGNFPAGSVHDAYNAVLAVSGGKNPYHFSVKTGTLPPGISLNPNTGTFSGTPITSGQFSFEVIATDAPLLDQGSQQFLIYVQGVGNGTQGVKVNISPATATLLSKQTQQFTATVSGTSNTAVTWSATSGSVDSNGLYTAPKVKAQTSVTVTATSAADSTKSASAALTVDPANQQSLQITTGALPQGQQGIAYSETFSASGGTTPYSWSVSAGTVPPGTAMNGSGNFTGVPTSQGTFNFTVQVTDASNNTAKGSFSVTMVASTGYDGPAQLPIATVASSMQDTPAPGAVIKVNSGGNLQAALNSAQCGNTIELQAGATFSGDFNFPALNCDGNHWLIVRTSSPDSALPAEGQRLTPCYAGVASLQGRPQYPCNNPQNVLAKIVLDTGGTGPVTLQSGANHYRFLGLEITRAVGIKAAPALIAMTQGGTGSYVVLDRSWLHGTTQDDTVDGFELTGTTNVAVVDSYFSDFHCADQCTDAHAVGGGNGNHQDGPYKIDDNFLEASGEAIMFGGGAATLTPTDIAITHNHFFKPWQWMEGNKPFVGGTKGNPFVVKNHLELKNAVRVLIEANLMENSWGGFTQTGYGIVLTPKNQHTKEGQDVCPLCQVTDVTIRYVQVSHAGGGIALATGISSGGKGGPALAGARWSIHDVVLDDLSTNYVGPGNAFLILNGWPKNPLNTITINHVTAFPDTGSQMIFMGNLSQNASMYGLVFTNNIMGAGRYPIWNTGGGPTNCAYSDIPITSVSTCFTTFTFASNSFIAPPPKYDPSTWPNNNMFPQSVNDVQFTNFKNGNGGNYELLQASPYKNKGTDGKDLGADIVGLATALQNVE